MGRAGALSDGRERAGYEGAAGPNETPPNLLPATRKPPPNLLGAAESPATIYGTMNDRRVRTALLALLLLGCTTGSRRPSPEPPDASAALPKIAATLLARKGKVELSRGAGEWSDARIGDQLVVSDALRTSDGEAEIGLGKIRMRLHASSALRLQRTA